MAPNPQEGVIKDAEYPELRKPETQLTGDEVVISGISGLFPRSDNVEEFMENLYNGVDMVTSEGTFNHPQFPKHLGKVDGFDEFDNQFFGVPHGQVQPLNPMCRKVLENAYEALFDAGVNPKTIAGTKVAVYSGASFIDVANSHFFDITQYDSNYIMTGSSKSMLANRISYWLDSKGPSYAIDATCSSSIVALGHAYRAIKEGGCSSAIVTGSNMCLDPKLTINLRRAGFLCLDGKTKCFDKNGDGFVRSEAVGVLFLQKASDAKRIYAEVVHTKEKYSALPDSTFLPVRKSDNIENFLCEFYSEVNVHPKDVEYLEAFGVAIQSGDENELEAISRIFARDSTVKVGCVKSNMGHSEGASDLCALIKVCLAYHKGQLPANLHYKEPQNHIPAIKDGKIQVVTETTPFKRGYTAINSFSYSGINQHTLMKGHYKKKNLEKYSTPIPRLVLVSGRLEESVSKILDSLKSHPVDAEQIALLHNFFAFGITGHTCRGYVILDTNKNNETISLGENVNNFPGTKAPVWFLYSGMGSQWLTMGAGLMTIPTFAASIERCRKVLEPKGIDLLKVLTSQDDGIFDNIQYAFVGITAVQIGLTDLLREMGIVPDNVIGHSLGEQGCAYADGCLTAEESILLSYSRGLVSVETKFIEGQMAAVGLGHEKLSALCPPEVEIACHNSAESSTISGPAQIVRKFVENLKSKSIFAKEVQTAKIAYHSKYIAEAGPRFLSEIKKIIKNPKLRSKKWLSTSAPPEKWDLPETKYCSAEYFVNNFLDKVYFEEAARKIPNNAVVIEIAPHSLLQPIVTKSHQSCTHISLTKRNNPDPVTFFLEAVGKLFQAGLTPKIDFLYPKIEFPVSTETPLLSSLVTWAHNEHWKSSSGYIQKETYKIQPLRRFAMTINDDEWSYFKGHVRNGEIIFPEMALLVLVWETLAMYNGLNYKDMSVIFEDICFEKELYIRNKDIVRFTIEIEIGCGRFEITDENLPIAYGFIKQAKNPLMNHSRILESKILCDEVVLTAKDVYMLLEVKGFSYTGEFQSILSSNTKFNTANIKWRNEWITFLASLIQLNTLSQDHEGVSNPKFIRKLSINTQIHRKIILDEVTAYYDSLFDSTRCGGVQIDNIIFKQKPILENESNILEIREFISCLHKVPLDIDTALKINMQIMTENLSENRLNIMELITELNSNNLNDKVKQIIENNFLDFDTEINCVKIDNEETLKNEINKKQNFGASNIFILHNMLDNGKILNKVYDVLKNNTFILTIEQNNYNFQPNDEGLFKIITSIAVGDYKMVLLRKTEQENNTSYIFVRDSKFSWIPHMRKELENGKKVILVSKTEECSGLPGFVKAIKKRGFINVGLFMINDNKAPGFSPQLPFYKEQIEKNLTFNILVKGLWGDYYYFPTKDIYEAKNDILTSKIIKDIDNFKCEKIANMRGSEKVQIRYAGTSMPCNLSFGMDFSGYNTRGEKVMGLVPSSALCSKVDSDIELLWPVPNHWTLEDAATVPQPYVYAYYTLIMQNKLQKNDSVLVLQGAGDLGQAIISICLDLKCTVFTLVNNVIEQQRLLKLFPNLKEEHITYSEHDVQSMVAYHAKKEWLCTYVISCATGDLRLQAMKCVGLMGTFVDLNNYDKEANKAFELSFLLRNKNYKSVILSSIFKTKNKNEKKILQHLLADGIASGVVKPLPRVIYSLDDVSKALTLASLGRCIGRILINMKDMVPLNKQLEFTSRITFNSKGSYIVICDETILGVEVAGWLIKGGVRKVILHQENANESAYYQARRKTWGEFGVLSALSTENLLTYSGCANLLNKCEKLGSVQGIFIIKDSKGVLEIDIDIQESITNKLKDNVTVVSNLDNASKKICNNLSYFVVVLPSTINQSSEFALSAIDNICENRKDAGLPTLVVHTDVLIEKNTSTNISLSENLSKLFNSLNMSLKYKYSNVVTRELKREKDISVEFMNNMSKIIGIPKLEAVEETKTLSSFGINEDCVDKIRALLNRTFKIDYSPEELHRISLKSLKKLCNNVKPNTSTVKGLKAFYNYIEVNEIFAGEPIIILPSQIANCIDKMPQELLSNETYLIMIPGFEGHSRIFSSIGERLKIQAASLQLSPDLKGDSIPQMAKNLFYHVKETFKFNSKFYILGYSFGVNIALEMAAMLEKEGHIGVIYCLDSSPDVVKVQLNSFLGKLPEFELQNTVITELYSIISGKDNKNLCEKLLDLDDWSKKVEYTVKKLQQSMSLSFEYLNAVIESAYKRIILAKAYEPDIKLKSKLVLIKGIAHPKADLDYNLQKYSEQPVSVFKIETDHLTIPFDSDVSRIVNKMLEPKLLEEYKNRNLCDICPEIPKKIQISQISALRVVT